MTSQPMTMEQMMALAEARSRQNAPQPQTIQQAPAAPVAPAAPASPGFDPAMMQQMMANPAMMQMLAQMMGGQAAPMQAQAPIYSPPPAQAQAPIYSPPPAQAQAPAIPYYQPVSGQVIPPAPARAPRSVGQIITRGSGSFDGFIGENTTHFTIGGKGQFRQFVVGIDLKAPVSVYQISLNKTTIWKSYNGITAVDGRPWQQAVTEAAMMGKAPIETFDIPMVVLEPAPDITNPANVIKPGYVLGYTPSIMKLARFQNIVRQCYELQDDNDEPVLITRFIKCLLLPDSQQNSKGNWATIKWTSLGDWDGVIPTTQAAA